MKIIKDNIDKYKTNYIMLNNKEPSLVNIADDIGRNYVYIRQIFSYRPTSYKLAKEICSLVNMEVEEMFTK